MASRHLPLPTEEQCYGLSDDQCRLIQEYQDPHGRRTNRDWEISHQGELIRYYMLMLSFKQMEDNMRPRLTWTYKTYQNRFKDWQFPLDRLEREHVVRGLFERIRTEEDYMQWSPSHTISTSQARPIQPHPSGTAPLQVPPDFFRPASTEFYPPRPDTRLSISTTGTFASGSTHSSYNPFDDTFSSHRASIATTSSSVSNTSYYGIQYRPPKHDPVAGLWNNVLRVIPGCTNHTALSWKIPFNPCYNCGFSRWHSLMVHAQSVGIDSFVSAMTTLRGIPQVDFAGNYPIHYLMSAGVGLEFLNTLTQWTESCPRNVFDQNPLHALNPLGLGEQLVSFLEWLRNQEDPPRLLDQRDIHCRTPLQALLLWPLDRNLYPKILDAFPSTEQQLRAVDTTGRTIVTRMNKASLKIKAASPSEFAKIQAGITEIKLYLSSTGGSQDRNQHYGFHDIARGRRGLSISVGYFQCKICNQINAHSNSYWEQIWCAIQNGRDRYEPDDTGMTPAHALVTLPRFNMNEEGTGGTPIPETASQTAKLFQFLIPQDDPRLHEVLHALDPQGHSLVYNIAIRGLDELLKYVLDLEPEHRRRATANFCGRIPHGELSVLDAVHIKVQEATHEIENTHGSKHASHKRSLMEHRERLIKCKALLCKAGAVSRPDPVMRWRIHFDDPVAESIFPTSFSPA